MKTISYALFALIALLAGCNPRVCREDTLLKLLPREATEVRSQTIPAGIDYCVFIKAKMSETSFFEFMKITGLTEGGTQNFDLRGDDVKDWWSPGGKGIHYGRIERGGASDFVKAISWATYEDGYVYFKYTDI